MPKNFIDWYENLPGSKQKRFKKWAISIMGRSTLYKILKEEFKPSKDRQQSIANFAQVELKFGDAVVAPQPPSLDVIGHKNKLS